MSQSGPDDLSDRIARAQAAQDEKDASQKEKTRTNASGSAGMALRYSAELVATVLVGTLIGWLIDRFFGTSPWGLLIMMGFGMAAGLRNVIRAANKMTARAIEDNRADSPNKDD